MKRFFQWIFGWFKRQVARPGYQEFAGEFGPVALRILLALFQERGRGLHAYKQIVIDHIQAEYKARTGKEAPNNWVELVIAISYEAILAGAEEA